jgi:peptidoglycan/LPS O-acetylase OafA/YrhL
MVAYIYVLQTVDISFALAKFDHYSRQSFFSKLTMTYGLFPEHANNFFLGEWTLSNEIFFYLLFPVVFPFARKYWKNALFFFIIALIMHYVWRYGWHVYKASLPSVS